MNACHFCRGAITRDYFRVHAVMACPTCVAKERENERVNKGRFFRRGLFFAILAAILGCLAMWGIFGLSGLSDSSSLFSRGALLRGTGVVFLGYIIGAAAIAGAKKRGSRSLQISAMILTYLAYCFAFVPLILSQMPSSRRTVPYVATLMMLAPAIPFLAVWKNLMAITGLAAIFIACSFARRATGPMIQVTGPFDVNDRTAEEPMFKGLEG
jgi:hypothetical protein